MYGMIEAPLTSDSGVLMEDRGWNEYRVGFEVNPWIEENIWERRGKCLWSVVNA